MIGMIPRTTFILITFIGVSLFIYGCEKAEVTDIEHLQRAKNYLDKKDYRASIIELKNSLQVNPKNAEARLMLGEIYVTLGNGAAAEKEIKRAQESGVQSQFIQVMLGKSILLQNKYGDVLRLLDQMSGELSSDSLVLKGDALLGLGEKEKAITAFKQAEIQDGNNIMAKLGQVRVSMLSNNLVAAGEMLSSVAQNTSENPEISMLVAELAEMQGNHAAAIDAYKKALSLTASSVTTRIGMNARSEMAKIYIESKQYQLAEEHVNYLLKVSPKHPVTNYMAALLAYNRKEYGKARDYLVIVSKLKPDNFQTIFLLGSCNFALGNYEQAMQQLGRVVTSQPSFLPARMMLASLRLRQAQASEALDLLEPAISQKSDDATLLAMAGEAALRSGDFQKSESLLNRAVSASSDNSNIKGQLALLYIKEGNQEKAIKELESIIKQGKSSQKEISLLALSHLRNKEYVKSVSVVEDLLKKEPDSAYAYNLLGVIYMFMDKPKEARDYFQKSLQLDSNNVITMFNLARIDTSLGDLAKAKKGLEHILVIDSKNVGAMISLAQLEEISGNKQAGINWLEKSRSANAAALEPRLVLANYYLNTNELVKAKEIGQEASRISPNDARVLNVFGKIQIALNEYNSAIDTFKKLVEKSPSENDFYNLAIAQFRAGKLNAAKSSLLAELKLQPKNLKASSLLIVIYVSLKEYDKALTVTTDTKRLFPDSPASYVLEGDIRAQQNLDKMAIQAYTKAINLGADNTVLIKKIEAIKRADGYAAAIPVINTWLNEHDQDVKVRYVLASTLSNINGQNDQAIKEYRRILSIYPDYVPALNDLAWQLFTLGQLSDASTLAEKAYKLSPDTGVVLDTLGWIKFQQGEMQQALALLRDASSKLPENPDIQYHLAAVLAKSGKLSESKQLLEELLKIKSAFSSRHDAEQLFRSL